MIFAEAVQQVIQVEWQSLAAFGSIVGGAIVGAAKIVANQLGKNAKATDKRHEDNRTDAREARDENRALSAAILNIQSQTVKTLAELQAEIRLVLQRLDACEDGAETGSKTHPSYRDPKKGK